jgi:hypothetical protein
VDFRLANPLDAIAEVQTIDLVMFSPFLQVRLGFAYWTTGTP